MVKINHVRPFAISIDVAALCIAQFSLEEEPRRHLVQIRVVVLDHQRRESIPIHLGKQLAHLASQLRERSYSGSNCLFDVRFQYRPFVGLPEVNQVFRRSPVLAACKANAHL